VLPLLDAITPYARALLDGPAGEPDPPIRADLFGLQRFQEHGISLARAQTADDGERAPAVAPLAALVSLASGSGSFFPRVDDNLDALRRDYDYVALTSRSGLYVTPAAEWLLDNFHLVEAQLQQIREGVPRRYYADLPKLTVAPLQGLPRIYGIAWAYVAHTDSTFDTELFSGFLDAYQKVQPLRLSELWALPTTLRVVLLENLRRVADGIASSKAARELAHAAWDDAAALSVDALDELLDLMDRRGLARAYLTQLWQRMPTERLGDAPPLAAWVERHCPDGPALVLESQAAQVAANLTVGNIITTLRLIGQVDWAALIEPLSRPLRVLHELPGFAQESELTRKQINHALERLARRSGEPEQVVARFAVDAAQAATGAAERTAAWHLIGGGRPALETALGLDETGRSHPLPMPGRLTLYLSALALGTVVLAWWAGAHGDLGGGRAGDLGGLIALLLLVWPASEAVVSFVHRLLAESVRTQPLPRLDCTQGIPPDHRVLVVIPSMLTSEAGARALAQQLELHWLANREAHAQFALLTDWADAPHRESDNDGPLLVEALRLVAGLNQRYPAGAGEPSRFLLIHRGRTWCETQAAWLGWERKRGKLEMLIRWLATGNNPGFRPLADGMALADGIRHVLTLDSDTGLPPGALRELVAVAAHPLNAPQVDAAARRVTRGYGVLQPRVVTPLPDAAERTPYQRLFAGQCGIDPYSSGVSDVYQDVFGNGSFSGKGLLDVRALHAVLDARLPEGTVLSHDLLEGTVAGCGYVSDVVLVEDQPHHAGVGASRLHRWTRGDWQLLPLMRDAHRHGIDALGLWKMADNLRRSLVLPASWLLLVWVLFTGAMHVGTALAVVGAALLAGPLLGAAAGLVPTRRGIAWAHFFHVGLRHLGASLATAAYQFSQLPLQALLQLDAVLRTLWRVAVSRRKLLEWTTAAQAQSSARRELGAFVREHAGATALCAALATVSLAGPHPVAGLLLFGLWACAPLVAWWASRPGRPPPEEVLGGGEQAHLLALARDTWRFFERCIGPEDNHLPPDNLQMVPEPTIAHRTSPTNIGLYLLAVACAREFGWIGTDELLRRLGATLDTIERLPKHEGHLYNWYETRTLEVLPPPYVSTVDSGNFAGLLLAVAQACLELARRPDHSLAQQHTLLETAARCRALFAAMDFRGLYDPRRHLFHIGLRPQEKALDASHYDLLASESRLTSLLAVAKGDVPRRHWQALGRPFLSVGVLPGLKSWSGSMFEYLMPALLMPEPAHGLLHEACRAAVQEQRDFAHAEGLPWGISESAYFAQDHSLAFQYSPFGAPRLALRRTPPADRVVAPYATAMALLFDAPAASANLRRLERLGARGEFGFYEAVDFTSLRQPEGQAFSLVEAYMAHHQGMSLAALCNLLCDDAPRRWFGSDALVSAHRALLHERTPRQIARSPDPRTPPQLHGEALLPFQPRDVDPALPGWKPTHLLSNGRYSLALRASGAGVSRWQGANVSRWRDDLLRDAFGTFFYLRRAGRPTVSLTAVPAPGAGWRYNTRFLADRVQFDAQGEGLTASTSVLVSPGDDTELRVVTLHNTGETEITCELVSCFEAVLADPRADDAHPAFSNLFIQPVWRPEWRALLLTRRPRLANDPTMAVAHFLAEAEADVLEIGCITDRRALIGRGRSGASPAFDAQEPGPDGTPPSGLDPVASLRVRLRLAPGAIARLGFATAAGTHEDELAARIDTWLQPVHVQRAARMAATLAQVRLRDLGIGPDENAALQDLTTALMYTAPRPAAEPMPVDQRQLWRFGISGDRPIVLVRIHSANGLPLVHALLRAGPWWNFGGLGVDIVVLNGEPNAYMMPLQRDILALRDRLLQRLHAFPGNASSGFYLLRDHEVSASEKAALSGLARVVLTADGRPLELQVTALRDAWNAMHAPRPSRRRTGEGAVVAALPASAPAAPVTGEFDASTGEFRFSLAAGQATPRPWVNVIANPGFGFQVSEAGAGFTWAGNSRLHQVTPWSNDAVRDPAGEHWVLQDLDTQRAIVPMPSNAASPEEGCTVRHGQGYTVFETTTGGLSLRTTLFADIAQPVKVVMIELRNGGDQRRRLRAFGIAEWQMGAARGERRTVRTWKDGDLPVLYAQQREARAGFGGATAFLALALAPAPASASASGPAPQEPQWTCDRAEFFDALGRPLMPHALGSRAGAGLDPCAALACDFVLEPGASATVAFALGHADDAGAAAELARAWSNRHPEPALDAATAWWDRLLGTVQVETPDPLFDALVNRWLLYQTVSCRMWARAGFYQAGGAYGYRDQLQDAMALALADPARLRAQIVLHASRQFPEGDVQHWWHSPGGAGVRTHFSDDLLWLPYACAHYVEVTGDAGVLGEQVPFIDGPAIPDGAEDAYYAPEPTTHTSSVYDHCARAIDHSLAVGAHGLPLMGTGDWNDGMNRVGHEGRGESVWLGWFLCSVVERFAPVAQARGDGKRAQHWLQARDGWIAALHDAGWDGAWFRRAFFDNGAPLGSAANDECRIDLIAQAWAVLSGASREPYVSSAMRAMRSQLIDREMGLLKLLTPPLQSSADNPGYIQAYPPGVRENGGQYAHGAVWAMMAQALSGDVTGAWESFESLSPAHRSRDPRRAAAYELEPYVMAGDIYGADPYIGRGGWSWYTGSAAWLYRAALETLLGLAVRDGSVALSPRVPPHWDGFTVRLKLQGRALVLRWQRVPDAGTRLRWGEWIEFSALPADGVLTVAGEPQAAAEPAESPA